MKPIKTKLPVLDDSPTGDALLDEALTMITEAKRPRKLKDWVHKLGGIKNLKHKVAQALADDGIVSHEKEKVLWLFERQVYPEVNPKPEQELRQAMRDAVLSDSDDIEPKVAIAVALANSAKLLPQVFSKQELKDRKQRIKQLENGELVSKAAKEAVQAIEAAVMVAVIMPAITQLQRLRQLCSVVNKCLKELNANGFFSMCALKLFISAGGVSRRQ